MRATPDPPFTRFSVPRSRMPREVHDQRTLRLYSWVAEPFDQHHISVAEFLKTFVRIIINTRETVCGDVMKTLSRFSCETHATARNS